MLLVQSKSLSTDESTNAGPAGPLNIKNYERKLLEVMIENNKLM